MPWIAALGVAYINQFFMGTILRREPSIPLEGVMMARHKMYVSSDKARRKLGYSPRPAEEALRAAVEYFRRGRKAAIASEGISKVRAGAA